MFSLHAKIIILILLLTWAKSAYGPVLKSEGVRLEYIQALQVCEELLQKEEFASPILDAFMQEKGWKKKKPGMYQHYYKVEGYSPVIKDLIYTKKEMQKSCLIKEEGFYWSRANRLTKELLDKYVEEKDTICYRRTYANPTKQIFWKKNNFYAMILTITYDEGGYGYTIETKFISGKVPAFQRLCNGE